MSKESNGKKTFMMFFLAFLVAFFIISFVEVIRSSLAPVVPDVRQASAVAPADVPRVPLSFADLATKLKPAVVNISTTKTVRQQGGNIFRSPLDSGDPFERFFRGDDFFEKFFGDIPQREFKQKSLGSGFIISHDGYVFTNNHVVEQADKILVKLSDGKEYEAKVIGKDAKTDIALIKIKPSKSLPIVEIGDSDKLQVGDWVLAIGNPFGLEQTVTAGIVSAKGRVIGAGPYDNFIQTDASINPGNSGGPLFNMEGKVIGINAAIVAQGQGIGFAIPINMANRILPDLKIKGKVTRGWLGVSIQDITEEIAKNLKRKELTGALVAEVLEGDPAYKAGLKVGDIIIEVNGKKIHDSHELLVLVADFRVGEKVVIKVLRDGQEKTFQAIVAERTEKVEVAAAGSANNFGMTLQEITPEIAKYLGMSKKTGIIVVDVKEGSPADEAGIRPRDVILEAKNQDNVIKINSLKDFERAKGNIGNKDGFLLLIKRGNFSSYVPIRP